MAFIEYNNNPVGRRVGDCAVRAVSKALNMGQVVYLPVFTFHLLLSTQYIVV